MQDLQQAMETQVQVGAEKIVYVNVPLPVLKTNGGKHMEIVKGKSMIFGYDWRCNGCRYDKLENDFT